MKKKLIQIRASEDEIAILSLLANIKKCSKSEVIRDVYINHALELTGLDKKFNIQTLIRELRNMSISTYETGEIINRIYEDAIINKTITPWPISLEDENSSPINLYFDKGEIKEFKFVNIKDLNFAFKISLIDEYVVAKTDYRELILKFAFNKENMFCFILTFDDNAEEDPKLSPFLDFTVIKENEYKKFESKILETIRIYTENSEEIKFENSFEESINIYIFLKKEILNIFNSLRIYE